jgi:hypothetical protein
VSKSYCNVVTGNFAPGSFPVPCSDWPRKTSFPLKTLPGMNSLPNEVAAEPNIPSFVRATEIFLAAWKLRAGYGQPDSETPFADFVFVDGKFRWESTHMWVTVDQKSSGGTFRSAGNPNLTTPSAAKILINRLVARGWISIEDGCEDASKDFAGVIAAAVQEHAKVRAEWCVLDADSQERLASFVAVKSLP